MNYEGIASPIPRTALEVEKFEAWLERAGNAGGELISTMDSAISGMVLCIFRVEKKGALGTLRKEAIARCPHRSSSEHDQTIGDDRAESIKGDRTHNGWRQTFSDQ